MKRPTPADTTPLIVDFDGTLHHSDTSWEALAWCLKHDWKQVLLAAVDLALRGRAAMKLRLMHATEAAHYAPLLPWDERVIAFVKDQYATGRPVRVVTGSAQPTVVRILKDKGLDWPVDGTHTADTNLVATAKADALVTAYGAKGFDYMGNSRDDLAVWKMARKAYVVNASEPVHTAALALGNVAETFPRPFNRTKALLKQLRPHQWLKNLLVAVPMVTSHTWDQPAVWVATGLAFAAFCLAASAAYALNDLLDIQDDRAHASKHRRPMASGALPLPYGLALAPVLICAAMVPALALPPVFLLVLAGYVGLTLSYSWWLKRLPMVDVATLSGLYGIRMVGGAAACGIVLTHWLVLFGFLVFFSLALMKRFTEVRDLPKHGKTKARGYHVEDADILAMMGVASGLMAAVVLALYTQSPDVALLYKTPGVLGVLAPVLILILSRMWLLAHRGQMHEDPVVFAARDHLTWGVGVMTLAIMTLGSL